MLITEESVLTLFY